MRLLQISGLSIPLLLSGCVPMDMSPPEMVSISRSQPLEGEKSLDAEIRSEVGTLELSRDEGSNLYSLDLDYDSRHYRHDLRYDKESGGALGRLSLRLEKLREEGIGHDGRVNLLRLALSNSLPIRLNIGTGVGEARLALSGIHLARLDLESGVGETRISAFEPNAVRCEKITIRNGVGSLETTGLGNLNFRELDFEGGVGAANLDFTGEWREDAKVQVEVGVGGVSIRMPREVGVRVEATKHLLSGMHLDGFTQRDSAYYSSNYDDVSIRVFIRVVTGVGGFRITWA